MLNMYKFKKMTSLFVLLSIIFTTLFSYPIFASDVTITLNYSEVSVEEGGTVQLTATTDPAGLDIDWYCGDGDAEVSSNGLVTGITAGNAEIIVTAWDDLGNEYTAYCTVYVYKPDGVYYIKNLNSNYYLHTEFGGIENGTNVKMFVKSSTTDIRQLWKTTYLGEGRYSIRPYHKLNMGLYVDTTQNNNIEIKNIGTVDTLSGIPSEAEWTVSMSGAGYLLLNDDSRYLTMQVENSSTALSANVVAGTYSNSNNCRWTFEAVADPPEGIYFYDTQYKEMYTSSPKRHIAPKETLTLSQMKLQPIQYSDSFTEYTIFWSSSNTDIATVDPYSGTVTGVSCGTVNITAYTVSGGFTGGYTLEVTTISNGTYYLRNVENGCYADMTSNLFLSGAAVNQNSFSENNITQWTIKRVDTSYYTISTAQGGKVYYLSVKNGSQNVDVGIVVYDGTPTDYMKWKFEAVYNNNGVQKGFKIIPQHTAYKDYVLATATSSSNSTVQLIQGDYVENTSYRDTWCVFEPYDMVFYSIPDEGHDHYINVDDVSEIGGWETLIVRTSSTGEDCREDLASHEYFIARTHGNYQNSKPSTDIELHDTENIHLYSHEVDEMSDDSDYLHSNDNFSNLKLALFVACWTGYGGENGNNLVSEIIRRGARTAIGFNCEPTCANASTWTERFWRLFLEGNTVEMCAQIACEGLAFSYDDIVICGDLNLTIYD